jgi:hypothetical protein
MQTVRGIGARLGEASPRAAIADLDNDSLIIRLHFTVNHLSRWLTPIHDPIRLMRTVRRGEPTVKDLLLVLRDEELRIFAKVHLIAVKTMPDLDKLPEPRRTEAEARWDRDARPLEIMAEFRRLRQSTCSLLRSLPDSGWERVGISRREHDWTIRGLAEHLAAHDLRVLREIDLTLDRVGAREGISPAARVHLDELLRLVPATARR